MKIVSFMLRTYRFPVPEVLIVGLTALCVASSIYLSAANPYIVISSLAGVPRFAAVVLLCVFLWEFISRIRGSFANTVLSLPLSRVDLYVTYLVGSVGVPLAIIAIPVGVAYSVISTSFGKGFAIAMFSTLANSAMIFSIALTAGITSKSRGVGVGTAIALWIALPVVANVVMFLTSSFAKAVHAKVPTTTLLALACLNPSSIVSYATSIGLDVGSILFDSGVINLAIAIGLIIATWQFIAKRWEPT